MFRTLIGAVIVVVTTGALAGCGAAAPNRSATGSAAATPAATEQVAPGDIPDTQAYVTTKAPSGRWSLKVPEGWAQQGTATGFTFTDKLNRIGAVERAASQVPTVAIVRGTEVPALQRSHPGLTLGSVAPFTRSGGSGVVAKYQLDSAKDPVTGKVHRDAAEEYVFFERGREVVVTVSGAVGADNVDPWRIVTDSFRWLR